MLVKIGNKLIGEGNPCFIVADIGINHNGSMKIAKQLIKAAYKAGCDAVKFQKRTIDVVYTKEELDKPRETPFGKTNRELKEHLEFSRQDYVDIDYYCRELGILWFASSWDIESVDFIERFNPPCHKIASPLLTHTLLLERLRATGRPLILSIGMSTPSEIEGAVLQLDEDNLIILQCTSTYPCAISELNLNVIRELKALYRLPVGYSGHEVGLATTVAAVALGAKMVERHITLDRAMWGSDQAASVEPLGFERLVKYIHSVEGAMGDGMKIVYDSEVAVREKLRRV
ncbi:hypothetical protein LCGC14_0396770 [marine sediment metagenome]|uniref:PseI/NeuA/B-like domain-containing protein n=1 Tax=marine sediment metagenome TaxID=412755 RepID=A0A0F9SY86_9ZZZZ